MRARRRGLSSEHVIVIKDGKLSTRFDAQMESVPVQCLFTATRHGTTVVAKVFVPTAGRLDYTMTVHGEELKGTLDVVPASTKGKRLRLAVAGTRTKPTPLTQ